MRKLDFYQQGFSVLELILAVSLFVIFSTAVVKVILQGFNSNRLGGELTVASQYAAEGIEALRSIKNQDYTSLVDTSPTTGIVRDGTTGLWKYSGTVSDALGSDSRFIRTIKIEAVQRDASPPDGNIVVSGGTSDTETKKITSNVSWSFNSSRTNTAELITYLTNWKKPLSTVKNGLLIYGDGGTTSDAIKYKIFDGSTGAWGVTAPVNDFDTSTTNKALRTVRVYSSPTRANERIAISRHYNGSTQFIYAHVFNGTNWSSTQLSTWNSTTFLDVYNYDGGYLSNGNFVAVYSDNTTTPKTRIWNGISWATQASTVNVGGIPNNIVTKNRPGTNEVLMATFDQGNDTNTSYYNGSTWSAAVEHATAAPTNTKEFVDFIWSPQNSSKGALIYASGNNDNSMQMKICTASCAISSGWSAAVNTVAQGVLGAMEIDGRKGAEEFLTCDKDANNAIFCFRGNTTPSFTNPTNRQMTSSTDNGVQRSFDAAYEVVSGSQAIVIYADTNPNLNTPKLKVYNALTNTFNATGTNLSVLNGGLKTVKLRPDPVSDDIMIIMADSSAPTRLYTLVWDGTNDIMYTTPAGKTLTTHGTNGSVGTASWYGFVWDAI